MLNKFKKNLKQEFYNKWFDFIDENPISVSKNINNYFYLSFIKIRFFSTNII